MDNSNDKQMISEIVEIVSQTSITTLNNKNIKYKNLEDYIIGFLNVTDKELRAIVGFVVEFLPQRIYLDKYQSVRDHVLEMISRELILFLVQEDKKSKQFQNNIKNFRDEIVNEIVNNIYVLDEEIK
jgi:hypothetical protein